VKVEQFTSGANSEHWAAVGSPGDIAALFASVRRKKTRDPWHVYEFAVANGMRVPAQNPADFNRPAFSKSIRFMNMPSPATLQMARYLRTWPRRQFGIDWQNLERTPEAIKFQESWNVHTGEPSGRAIELARFAVPKNEVGIITTIKTSLSFTDNAITMPPGDPAWFKRDYGASGGQINCTWFLKYENQGDSGSSPYNFRNVPANSCTQVQIPGTEHPDFPSWNVMLYPWCCDNRVFIYVPANHMVSLWAYFAVHVADAWQMRDAGGLLKGFTQVQESDQTYKNVTRGLVI